MANQNRLHQLVADLKAFDDEVAEIKAERALRVKEARKEGFPMKVIEKHLKREKMDPDKRDEEDALLEIVEAQLGKRNGVPLSERALRRLERQEAEDRQMPLFDEDGDDGEVPASTPRATANDTPAVEDSDDVARDKGAEAARTGIGILANPYPPRSSQRAAWEESWCQTSGSDGMEIPAAFKPTPKPKKAKKGGGDKGDGE